MIIISHRSLPFSFTNWQVKVCPCNINIEFRIGLYSECVLKTNFIMESADVRHLRTSLFSHNERARLCERVSFVKTNECVNIVRQHFPWRNLYFLKFRFSRVLFVYSLLHTSLYQWYFIYREIHFCRVNKIKIHLPLITNV